MGIRTGAAITLEQAFAGAFGTYFVGDPSFTKSDGHPFFVSGQSVRTLSFPNVCFMCLEAKEQIALSAIYMAELHIIIDTPLNERPGDYEDLLALHETRVTKCVNLMGNVALLQQLLNAPPAGAPDNRVVKNFQLYGVGDILKESNKREPNRLTFIQSVNIPFQPI